MRVTLATDDGEIVAAWKLPGAATAAELEQVLVDGLWSRLRIDRCDECRSFAEAGEMTRPWGYYQTALCGACAKKWRAGKPLRATDHGPDRGVAQR